MNLEKMNCECLQSIINNDESRHTYEEKIRDLKLISKSLNKGKIIFGCNIIYHLTKRNLIKFRDVYDKTENDLHTIPILYCPICGLKTKHNIPETSFYYQFQKK